MSLEKPPKGRVEGRRVGWARGLEGARDKTSESTVLCSSATQGAGCHVGPCFTQEEAEFHASEVANTGYVIVTANM